MLTAGFAVPFGHLAVQKSIGPVSVELQATTYVHSVSYEGRAAADVGGVAGAIGGGALGAGTNFGGNFTQADTKVYLTGLGDFQETIGFLKGSGKERTHALSPFIHGTDSKATVQVTTAAELIPWWPVGVAQGVTVTVRLTQLTNATMVTVERVWVEVWRQNPAGAPSFATVWERTGGETELRAVGDSAVQQVRITIPQDIGKFGLVGRAEVRLTNATGHSNDPAHILGSFRDQDGPSKILLWTVGPATSARVVLLMGAFPLLLLSVAMATAGTVLAHLGRPRSMRSRGLIMAGTVLGVLAAIFMITGLQALVGLTGFEEDFTLSPLLALPVVGAVIALAGAAQLSPVRRPPKGPEGTRQLRPRVVRPVPSTTVDLDEGPAPGGRRANDRKETPTTRTPPRA